MAKRNSRGYRYTQKTPKTQKAYTPKKQTIDTRRPKRPKPSKAIKPKYAKIETVKKATSKGSAQPSGIDKFFNQKPPNDPLAGQRNKSKAAGRKKDPAAQPSRIKPNVPKSSINHYNNFSSYAKTIDQDQENKVNMVLDLINTLNPNNKRYEIDDVLSYADIQSLIKGKYYNYVVEMVNNFNNEINDDYRKNAMEKLFSSSLHFKKLMQVFKKSVEVLVNSLYSYRVVYYTLYKDSDYLNI